MICMGKIYLYFNSHLTYNYIMMTTMNEQSLIFRLRKRAEIRRQIASRKSVQEGKPDRIADLLEEAARALEDAAEDQKMIHALEYFGVDNWEGYEVAMEYLEEKK